MKTLINQIENGTIPIGKGLLIATIAVLAIITISFLLTKLEKAK